MNPTTKSKLTRAALWAGLIFTTAMTYLLMGLAGFFMIFLGWAESIRDSLRERLGLDPLF